MAVLARDDALQQVEAMGLRALPQVEPRLRADQAGVVRRPVDDRLVVTRALVWAIQSGTSPEAFTTAARA